MGSPTYRLNSSLSPEAKGTIFTGETAPRRLRFGGRKTVPWIIGGSGINILKR